MNCRAELAGGVLDLLKAYRFEQHSRMDELELGYKK